MAAVAVLAWSGTFFNVLFEMVFEGADSILEREARALDLADQLLKLLVCVGNVLRDKV